MKHKLTYTLVLCLLVLVGCTASDGECRKEKVVVMGVSLYETVFNTEKEAFVSSPTKEKMTIKGLNNDSILYQEQSLSSFNLPLHALQSTSAFVLQRGVLEPDTIVISHENVNQFISLECGCFVYHTIKSTATTTHQIDSLVIENTYVQNVSENHLRIYYRVN